MPRHSSVQSIKQRTCIDTQIRTQHHERDQPLPIPAIRHPDSRRLHYVLVRRANGLHLPRADILPARYDHVVGPYAHEQAAPRLAGEFPAQRPAARHNALQRSAASVASTGGTASSRRGIGKRSLRGFIRLLGILTRCTE